MVSVQPPCATCLHVWGKRGVIGDCCGKEIVTQLKCSDARGADGDCGPNGRYYERKPSHE